MTIDKAIKILLTDYQHHHDIHDLMTAIAIKLGIEALKRVEKERTGYETFSPDLLPGETEGKRRERETSIYEAMTDKGDSLP